MPGMGKGHLDAPGPQTLDPFDRPSDRGFNLRIDSGNEVFPRDPDGPPLDSPAEERSVVRNLLRNRSRFSRVIAGNDIHQDRAVLHVLRERPDLVE